MAVLWYPDEEVVDDDFCAQVLRNWSRQVFCKSGTIQGTISLVRVIIVKMLSPGSPQIGNACQMP